MTVCLTRTIAKRGIWAAAGARHPQLATLSVFDVEEIPGYGLPVCRILLSSEGPMSSLTRCSIRSLTRCLTRRPSGRRPNRVSGSIPNDSLSIPGSGNITLCPTAQMAICLLPPGGGETFRPTPGDQPMTLPPPFEVARWTQPGGERLGI